MFCAPAAGTIVPMAEFPPAMPFTSQVIEAPLARQKDAVKFCVPPRPSVAALGAIELLGAQTIVTLALADFDAFATLAAVIVTLAGEGGVAGAV
jgi:hypothetical protein